jgi:hydroxymethylbilane synthase
MQLRIGTRGSALARWQADWVAAQLRSAGINVELVLITTRGDQQQEPIATVGIPGVFTKEIQRALCDGRIDVAVHSLKDLPTDVEPGLCLAAVPPRAAIGDALVSAGWDAWERLPVGAWVGTGSLRRRAQLLHARPDLVMCDLRGNVDTRLRKLDAGHYDAIILAEAGLRRLELAARISQVLPPSILLPAVGQGALGIETRSDDRAARQALASLEHAPTRAAVVAERALLAALRGGCLAPIAAWGRIEGPQLVLTGRVLSVDGKRQIEFTRSASADAAETLGCEVAQLLVEAGATELIATGRGGRDPGEA